MQNKKIELYNQTFKKIRKIKLVSFSYKQNFMLHLEPKTHVTD